MLNSPYYNRFDLKKEHVETLVAAGVDINTLDHNGRNCALHAISPREMEKVHRLEDYGVNLTPGIFKARQHRISWLGVTITRNRSPLLWRT